MVRRADYDVVVIGGGPGGYVAAIRVAQLESRVALVERDALGGRCLNHACIPAKAILRVADIYSDTKAASRMGVSAAGVTIDWTKAMQFRARVTRTLTSGVKGLLERNGVDVWEGVGRLSDGGVEVRGAELSSLRASNVIIATGSVAAGIPGVEFGGRVVDPAAMWAVGELPERIAVAGAGPSGVEIASAFVRLGSSVVLIEALDRVLPGGDADVSTHLAKQLDRQGVALHLNTRIDGATQDSGRVTVSFAGREERVDHLCVATGRRADRASLGLEESGVALDGDLVLVDGRMQTSRAGVFAIGDLVHGPALAHKASEEGVIAAEVISGLDPKPLDYDYIPSTTFCRPQVATLGLTEEQAAERAGGADRISVGRTDFAAVGAATAYGERDGFVKIIADARYGEILGAHVVGAKAADLIAELSVAREGEVPIDSLARIVHSHPTLSEGVLEAARAADGWAIHA